MKWFQFQQADDWNYLAMIVDRLFLWLFTVATVLGTCMIILQAPMLYDTRIPIDIPEPTKPLANS